MSLPAIARSSVEPAPASEDARRNTLRVGILQGTRLVEERVLPRLNRVTIGSAAKSTFIVPSESLPPRWRLFERRHDRWLLCLGAEMSAQVAAGGAPGRYRGGDAPSAVRMVPLPDGARGKVTLGDTTVLFQLVRPPSRTPRPRLPVSVKRRPLAEIDGAFAAVLALVLVLHVVVVVYLRQVDWPRRPAPDEVPDRFVHQWMRLPRPPAALPVPPPTHAPHASESPPTAAPPPRRPRADPPSSSTTPPRSAQERHSVLEAAVRKLGVLPMLTARGDGARSPLADLLAPGAVDRPLDEALRDVNDIQVASGDSLNHLGVSHAAVGKIATVEALRGSGGISAPTGTRAVVERRVHSNLQVGAPAIEGGQGDPQAIAREVRERRQMIAACYERALKQQSSLAGKLVLRFTIAPAGTVAAVDFDEDTLNAPAVAACVRAAVLRWRFTSVGRGPIEVSFPFVFQPSE